ncbi:BolA/IbaG family iron-sulfur metabolism protein [Luminiphilus sp.]|nr:BolA/IbaG family iron-sulfur metabolism protein [Luminiphilus sp.]MDA9710836.1 BolA/IbaG family iron-sulfur metabolism protein [Luminiphilus sp.]
MNEEDLIVLLRHAFPDAQVSVALNGGHADISVTSSVFEGLRPVARQQRVYAPLASLIADGTLHAVNISAQTP